MVVLATALPCRSTIEKCVVCSLSRGARPPRIESGGVRRLGRDAGGARRGVGRRDQRPDRHGDEVRVAEVLGAVGEDALLQLGHEVHVGGRCRGPSAAGSKPSSICSSSISATPPEEGGAIETTRRPR